MQLGKLGVWFFNDRLSAPEAAAATRRMEGLGYAAVDWEALEALRS